MTEIKTAEEIKEKIETMLKVAYYDGFNQSHYSWLHPDQFPVKECSSAGEEYLEKNKKWLHLLLEEYKSQSLPVDSNWQSILHIMFETHQEYLPNVAADHEQSELYMYMAKRIEKYLFLPVNCHICGYPKEIEPLPQHNDKEDIVNECRDLLLKQMFLMTHENNYPSEAVPKATILSLPQLMKVSPKPFEEDNLLKAIEEIENLKKQLGEQIAGAAMSNESLLEINRKIKENTIDKAIGFCDEKIADGFSDAENYAYEQMKQYLQTLK